MPVELERMEHSAAAIGKLIADTLHDHHQGKVRFCLIIADTGEAGWFTYVSNIQRESTVGLLKEAVDKISADPSGRGSLG